MQQSSEGEVTAGGTAAECRVSSELTSHEKFLLALLEAWSALTVTESNSVALLNRYSYCTDTHVLAVMELI